jgi:hypothetical protein
MTVIRENLQIESKNGVVLAFQYLPGKIASFIICTKRSYAASTDFPDEELERFTDQK